jgi:hypothetical protein
MLLATVFCGCSEDDEDATVPAPVIRPGTQASDGGVRFQDAAPVVDGGPQDAASDVGPDARTGDAGSSDAAGDAGPDATADAEIIGPRCAGDGDCVLGVNLQRCDACPIAVHEDLVAEIQCVVDYREGFTLYTYGRGDCTGACPEDACDDPASRAVCTAGRCVLVD